MEEAFTEQFPKSNNANSITDSSIQCLIKKFKSTGSVHDVLKSGRKRKQLEKLKEEIKEKWEAASATLYHCVKIAAHLSVHTCNCHP